MSRVWSERQNAIFTAIKQADHNIFVKAVAGSGKTTTVVEATQLCHGSRIFLAFNKAIADELQSRGVYAKTFHALCMSAVKRFKNVPDVDVQKIHRLYRAMRNREREDYLYASFVKRLVSLGRQAGVDCPGMLPNSFDTWWDLIVRYNMEFDSDICTRERAIELATELLNDCNADPQLDFDDMLYLVVKHDLRLDRYDWVFVDEAQDTNSIQREILRKLLHENSRFVAVGDPKQSIYGFRGADSAAIETLVQEFGCTTYPLDVTYRCAKAIVEYAQQWAPDIKARDGAPDGRVYGLDKWDNTIFQPTDLVLCRNTRALVQLGFNLIRNQVPAKIMGKDIGEGLIALIKRMQALDLDELSTRLVEWRDREMAKAMANDEAAKAEAVLDKADALLSVIDGMPPEMRTHEHVYATIEYLFNPNKQAVTLATIHKAKGLEAPRVFWLNRSMCPPKWVKSGGWQMDQELNLCYVAATRAKDELIFIEDYGMGAGRRSAVDEG